MNINFRDDKIDAMKAVVDPKQLTDKVQQLKNLEDEIRNAEEGVKKLKEQARIISELEIPSMMKEMNITKLKLSDGESVEVGKFYSASIPAEKQDEAFIWLRNNGLGDIIKNEINVSFGRNEDNKAAEYAELARSQGLQPTQKMKVEPMTLKALVRERIEAGKEMPTEIFSVFTENKTTIKRNK